MVPKEWSDVIAKHRPEVMRLINTSKRTGVVWQRYQGPAFTVHFMNSMNDPEYVIPKEIKNISFTTLLLRWRCFKKNAAAILLNNLLASTALPL